MSLQLWRALWLLVLWSLAPTDSHACLWLHGTTIEGHYTQQNAHDFAKLLRARIAMNPVDREDLFEPFVYTPDNPVGRLNDTAVQALLKGDAKLAVKLLLDVEAKHPGQYFTAANLGTAYELAGDDRKALDWILEGIKRNPDSHMRTEWLHARILETKLKLKDDPSWLAGNTITGADFSKLRESSYYMITRQRAVIARDLRDCLQTQLSVRMLFVKPKDVIVAQLLSELAMVEEQIGLLEQAIGYADLAELYGLPPEHFARKREVWNHTILWTPHGIAKRLGIADWLDAWLPLLGVIGACGLGAAITLFAMKQLKRFKNRARL